MKIVDVQERKRAYAQKYRRKNRDRILANELAWRDRNRKRLRKKHTLYMRRRRWDALRSAEPAALVRMWEWRRKSGQLGPKFAW